MNPFDRLKERAARWLAALKGTAETTGLGDRANQDAAGDSIELPPEQLQRIRARLQALPLPSPFLEGEISAIDTSLSQWLENPDTDLIKRANILFARHQFAYPKRPILDGESA